MHKGRTIGITLAALGMALAGGSLQAAAKEAPAVVAQPAAVLAGTPGMSPAPERTTFVARNAFGDYNCRSGRACLAVWNEPGGNWRVFDMYACTTYRLSEAYGQGGLKNNQTGGALVSMYGASGNHLYSFGTAGQVPHEVRDLSPVFTVRPC
ncbi:hypothetical protein E1263_20420 [Kribbella antibiotica]|uniref:Peptidase inhibitor family I36 protein n=1 Tax=Kribbella antibiotica TaxID=190195 RepID=A0A4V2YPG5_9ACTN|nr:hypothetical protein [Kribbella antibiotica]TDD58197.1 hypothetical protein E1263_20420 [Kribbella antibiotica]